MVCIVLIYNIYDNMMKNYIMYCHISGLFSTTCCYLGIFFIHYRVALYLGQMILSKLVVDLKLQVIHQQLYHKLIFSHHKSLLRM